MAFYLSVHLIRNIVDELIKGGSYQTSTPAAVVYRATWEDEKIIVGTLGDIVDKVREAKITKTAIIIVGNKLNIDNMNKKFRSTKNIIIISIIILGIILVFLMLQPQPFSQIEEKKELKIGYFPNINHAQAVIGIGNGNFQRVLGENVEIKSFIFNAGPSAIEAVFAKQVDVAYIGPNPAINGYVISEGKSIRVIAGASSGGAIFVMREDTGITSTADFANKKFASPQLGNTQDVALRTYLLDHGYKTVENNGNVHVLPAKNPDIVTLFLKKDIDGAWVPEPWGERLIKEANGKLFLDERDLWPDGKFVTGLIVVRTDYLQNNPDVIENILNDEGIDVRYYKNNKFQFIYYCLIKVLTK